MGTVKHSGVCEGASEDQEGKGGGASEGEKRWSVKQRAERGRDFLSHDSRRGASLARPAGAAVPATSPST